MWAIGQLNDKESVVQIALNFFPSLREGSIFCGSLFNENFLSLLSSIETNYLMLVQLISNSRFGYYKK